MGVEGSCGNISLICLTEYAMMINGNSCNKLHLKCFKLLSFKVDKSAIIV